MSLIRASAAGRLFAFACLLVGGAALAPCVQAGQTSWWTTTPSISIGPSQVNVHRFGAKGDGRHDDTDAIQRAIDSLPQSGGTVHIPAGTYLVDALKNIHLRSHVRLQMDSKTVLKAIPNASQRYYMIKVFGVNDVEIIGGTLQGERGEHRGVGGEWGYGLNISGSQHVRVYGVTIRNMWGDGLLVGAIGNVSKGDLKPSNDVTIDHVLSTNNRRQGLSITPANQVYVVNSTFSRSNGTAPQAGIDIEPMGQGPTHNIRIENCLLEGNVGNGLEMHAHIDGITMVGTIMQGNHGFGALSVAGSDMAFLHNTATQNGLAGLGINGSTHDVNVAKNRLTSNSTRYMPATHRGGNAGRDLHISDTTRRVSLDGNVLSRDVH